jgi:predicted ATPase
LEDFELRNLNVLIGANGAGKSNFIGLFKMLAAMRRGTFQLFVAQQGGPDALLHYGRKKTWQLFAEFFFGSDDYRFILTATSDNRMVFAVEELLYQDGSEAPDTHYLLGKIHDESKLAASPHSLFAPFPSSRIYHLNDTSESAKVKQLHGLDDTLVLKSDAANLAAYLHMLRLEHGPAYERVVETIRLAAPFFGDFVFRDKPRETIELEWTERSDPDTPLKALPCPTAPCASSAWPRSCCSPWSCCPTWCSSTSPSWACTPLPSTSWPTCSGRPRKRSRSSSPPSPWSC